MTRISESNPSASVRREAQAAVLAAASGVGAEGGEAAVELYRAYLEEEPDNPNKRSGFFIGLGLGYGALSIEGAPESEGGLSGMIRLGGALSQKVLLGVETNTWTKSESGATLTFSTFTAAIQFYPSATGGFFLTGGFGYGVFSLTGFDSQSGAALLLGLGYDIRVGGNISISPFLNGFASSINSVTVSAGQLGVALTIH